MTAPAPTVVIAKETKPGYKTTEAWATAGVSLAALLNLLGFWNWASNWHSGLIMGAVTVGYQISRGLAKNGVAYQG